jgi:hypothetical protein
MRDHREGRLTLRTHLVEPIAPPALEPDIVRETREALKMSRQVFAFKLGIDPRTLERWEQGRSKPNEQPAGPRWPCPTAAPAPRVCAPPHFADQAGHASRRPRPSASLRSVPASVASSFLFLLPFVFMPLLPEGVSSLESCQLLRRVQGTGRAVASVIEGVLSAVKSFPERLE